MSRQIIKPRTKISGSLALPSENLENGELGINESLPEPELHIKLRDGSSVKSFANKDFYSGNDGASNIGTSTGENLETRLAGFDAKEINVTFPVTDDNTVVPTSKAVLDFVEKSKDTKIGQIVLGTFDSEDYVGEYLICDGSEVGQEAESLLYWKGGYSTYGETGFNIEESTVSAGKYLYCAATLDNNTHFIGTDGSIILTQDSFATFTTPLTVSGAVFSSLAHNGMTYGVGVDNGATKRVYYFNTTTITQSTTDFTTLSELVSVRYINSKFVLLGVDSLGHGKVYQSTDNGISWTLTDTVIDKKLYDINYTADNKFVLSGEKGYLGYTTTLGNGVGSTFTEVKTNSWENLKSVVNGKNGDVYVFGDQGFFLYSTDSINYLIQDIEYYNGTITNVLYDSVTTQFFFGGDDSFLWSRNADWYIIGKMYVDNHKFTWTVNTTDSVIFLRSDGKFSKSLKYTLSNELKGFVSIKYDANQFAATVYALGSRLVRTYKYYTGSVYSQRFEYSDNSGVTWTDSGFSQTVSNYWENSVRFAHHEDDLSRVFMRMEGVDGKVRSWITYDQGASWEYYGYELKVEPCVNEPGTWIKTEYTGSIFRISYDYGTTWYVSTFNFDPFYDLLRNPRPSSGFFKTDNYYFYYNGNEIFRGVPTGGTMAFLKINIGSFLFLNVYNQAIVANGSQIVWDGSRGLFSWGSEIGKYYGSANEGSSYYLISNPPYSWTFYTPVVYRDRQSKLYINDGVESGGYRYVTWSSDGITWYSYMTGSQLDIPGLTLYIFSVTYNSADGCWYSTWGQNSTSNTWVMKKESGANNNKFNLPNLIPPVEGTKYYIKRK